MTYDAIVVGARCAGSPTAMLLARKGYRVLLVDKATFPSDTVSGHFILPSGVAQLSRWGLLDRIVSAASSPPIRSWRFDVGPFALCGSPVPTDGVGECYGPRRTALDTVLVEAAVEAGVELREAFSVHELVVEGDAVVGIRGRAAGGPNGSETASIVIGADGMRSIVARSVQAEVYEAYPRLACYYYAYWSGLHSESLELYPRDGLIVGVFPTTGDTSMVFVGRPADQFAAARDDVEGSYLRAVASVASVAERLAGAQRVERFYGSGDLPNFCRKPFGNGWALVGDAGYHKDPCLPLGISDAFRDAELLANAIDAGLSEKQSLVDALAQYERQRNAAAMPSYALTRQLAALQPPPPEMQQLFGALLHNQAETNNFFGALAGTVPIPEFFAPENLGRIISGATSAQLVAPG
jgi:flavin-dependent dehydrogenase